MTTIRTLNDGAIPTHTPELDVAGCGGEGVRLAAEPLI